MCGGEHAACGTAPESTPVDENMEVAVVAGSLQKYEVTTPNGTVTTMKLNEDDARRLGVLNESPSAAPASENPSEPEKVPAKKRAVSNKARTTATKDGGAGGGDD